MNISYEGIGQWAATFACGKVTTGHVVKVSDNAMVTECDANDPFDGVVVAVGRDKAACSVAMNGLQTVGYSGATVPAAGWNELKADGEGGVAVVTGGKSYLAVDVDTTAKTVTIML